MGITHFPNGVSSFGVPVLGGSSGLIPQTTGDYFFVDDSGSNANDGKDPDHPFADLDYAIGETTSDHGDVIILMPGHAESATAIAADKAGLTIVGLGHGEAMPTITGTTGNADLIDVTVDSVVFRNIKLVGGASGTTALIDATGDADFLTVDRCWLQLGAAAPVDAITLASGADDVTVVYCTFYGNTSALDNFILAEGAVQRLTVMNNVFDSIEASGADEAHVQFATTGSGGVLIAENYFKAEDADVLVLMASSTSASDHSGLITHNYAALADLTTIWGAVVSANFSFGPMYFMQRGTAWGNSVHLPATTVVA